jgi:hypothetical protein
LRFERTVEQPRTFGTHDEKVFLTFMGFDENAKPATYRLRFKTVEAVEEFEQAAVHSRLERGRRRRELQVYPDRGIVNPFRITTATHPRGFRLVLRPFFFGK